MGTVIGDMKRLSQSRKYRRIERVVQQSGTSCGIACVAMLARISYRDAFRCAVDQWDEGEWDGPHYTDAADLRFLLKALGWKLGRQVRVTEWSKVPDHSLVAIQERVKIGEIYWHWAVAIEGRNGKMAVLDPRKAVKSRRRTDLDRMRLSCYHRVTAQ